MTKTKLKTITVYVLFLAFTLFWLFSFFYAKPGSDTYQLYAATYGLIALVGGLFGLSIAREWGGLKSLIGKAVTFLSVGLLFQEFGQLSYSYLIYFAKTEIPYPSVGDVGFFGSVILYTIGALYLFKASGALFALENDHKPSAMAALATSIVLPILILAGTYSVFLSGYEASITDTESIIRTVLDVGYPLLQSVYLAIALLTLTLSNSFLGGDMKKRMYLLVTALCVQYAADFVFLYKASREIWIAGDLNDYMYQVAYFLMAITIVSMQNPKGKFVKEPAQNA